MPYVNRTTESHKSIRSGRYASLKLVLFYAFEFSSNSFVNNDLSFPSYCFLNEINNDENRNSLCLLRLSRRKLL